MNQKSFHVYINFAEPNSDYVITLRAKNEAGEGLQVYENVRTSEKTSAESAAPLTPPVGLKAIVFTYSTVVLHWTDMTLSKNQVSQLFSLLDELIKLIRSRFSIEVDVVFQYLVDN